MAAANDAIPDSCTNNPDFAVICSFFEQFGDKTGLLFPSFQDLQHMIENDDEVPYPLIELHVKLMRKLKKTVSFDRWEKAAAKFAHSYSDKDGWDIERFGYKNTNIEVKLRLLKNLLEAQFDGNVRFRNEINQVSCNELRLQPLGRDIHGRRYWHLLDDDCNLRIYREDVDEEIWELVSSDKESLVKLIEHLAAKKELFSSEETTPEISEENSPNPSEEMKQEVELKEEIPDRGESNSNKAEDSERKIIESPSEITETKKFDCDGSEPKRVKSEAVETLTENSAKCTSEDPVLSEAIEGPILFVKGEGNGADCETGNPYRETEQETCSTKADNEESSKATGSKASEDKLNTETEFSEPIEIETVTIPIKSTENNSIQSENVNPIRDKWKEPPPLGEKTDGTFDTAEVLPPSDQTSNELDQETCTTASFASSNCEKGAESLDEIIEFQQQNSPKNNRSALSTDSTLLEVYPALLEVSPVASLETVEKNLESSELEKPSKPIIREQISDSHSTESSKLPYRTNSSVKEGGDEKIESTQGFDSKDKEPELVTDHKTEPPPEVTQEQTFTRHQDVQSSESHAVSEGSLNLPNSDNIESIAVVTLLSDEDRFFKTLPFEAPEKPKENPPFLNFASKSNASIPKESQQNEEPTKSGEQAETSKLTNRESASVGQESVPKIPVTDEREKSTQKLPEVVDTQVDAFADELQKEITKKSETPESIMQIELSPNDLHVVRLETYEPVDAIKTPQTCLVAAETKDTTTKEEEMEREVKQLEEVTNTHKTDAQALQRSCKIEINTDEIVIGSVTQIEPLECESEAKDAIPQTIYEKNPELGQKIDKIEKALEFVNMSCELNQAEKTGAKESIRLSETIEKPLNSSDTNELKTPQANQDVETIEMHQPIPESSSSEKNEENVEDKKLAHFTETPDVAENAPEKSIQLNEDVESIEMHQSSSEDLLIEKNERNVEDEKVLHGTETLDVAQNAPEKSIQLNEDVETIEMHQSSSEDLLIEKNERNVENEKVLHATETLEAALNPLESSEEQEQNSSHMKKLKIIQLNEDVETFEMHQSSSETLLSEKNERNVEDLKIALSTETLEVELNARESSEKQTVDVDKRAQISHIQLDRFDTEQSISTLDIPKLAVNADEGFVKEESNVGPEQNPPCSPEAAPLNLLSDTPTNESDEISDLCADISKPTEHKRFESMEPEISKPFEPIFENYPIEAPVSAAEALPNASATKANEISSDEFTKMETIKTDSSSEENFNVENTNLRIKTFPLDECDKRASDDAEQVIEKVPKKEVEEFTHSEVNCNETAGMDQTVCSERAETSLPTTNIEVEKFAHIDVSFKETSGVDLTSCSEQSAPSLALASNSHVSPIKGEDERSATSTQLAFDFDASAPVPVMLPPIFKQTAEVTLASKRRGRKRGRTGEDDADESTPAPILRQSSRIAKLREKEDEERRKEEAERLQRLKEEHERREKRRAAREERMKKQEQKQQRRQQKSTKEDVVYEDSEDDSDSSEEEENSRKKGKKGRRKRGKKKKDRPWDSSESSESSSESDEDPLEELQAEADNEELVFKSDHEFSPESDLDGEEETVKPIKHARTARPSTGKKKARSKKIKEEEIEDESGEEEEAEESEDEELDTSCQKCGQSDHPEWILLCDRCDLGWHASCLKPPLMVIPEGDWFCPPCDHMVLLERLQERLEAYEFLLKEKEAEMERKRELEREVRLAEEATKQAIEEQEQEEGNSDEIELSADDANSGAGDVGADDVEDEETEEESGDEESDEEQGEESGADSDENLNKRRQRRAAKQANYSFKDFDDMIKSAIRDEGEEDPANPLGKGPRNLDDDDEEEEDGRRSPRSIRPSGKGEKRISTSDDDSDIMPKVIRKKKVRKLNDLSATEDEDDSDEEFKATSEDFSESEEEDEEASESGSSFVVDDDSEDDDIVHVKGGRRGRAASPVARRATRNVRKKYTKIDSDSESSEEESEYELSSKRKRGNDSWGESSADSSSDASWGRSKKRRKSGGRAKPPPNPKAKPAPRKAPAVRGRGRGGGRASRADSDDEPFRTKARVKKTKAARPVVEDDEGSDPSQRRTTRGKQTSYKDLISSGESNDESSKPKGAAKLLAASRRGRGPASGIPIPAVKVPVADKDGGRKSADGGKEAESHYLGSSLDAELAKAAAAFAEVADNPATAEVLPSIVEPDLALPPLPTVLPQRDVLIKEDVPAQLVGIPVLPPDLQVSRLIQQRSTDVHTLPADLQINRLINSQAVSSAGSSPARHSPMPQQRLLRDATDSQTPPPVQIPTTTIEQLPVFGHGGVIKQARIQMPPTPSVYQAPAKVPEGPSTIPSVIRPYPTPVAPTSSLSPSVPSGNSPGNPLSIQGLLASPHGVPPSSQASPAPIRPYANTSHMISHGPFLNHPPYNNPYSGVSSSRSGYMGTPVTPTPRPAYPQMYASSHVPPPHALPPIHSAYPAHHGAPLRPSAAYQHAGFPQAFAAAAAAAAANAEEERRIYRVTQGAREPEAFDAQAPSGSLLPKGGVDDAPTAGVPTESEFGGLVSYFSSQHEDFGEA